MKRAGVNSGNPPKPESLMRNQSLAVILAAAFATNATAQAPAAPQAKPAATGTIVKTLRGLDTATGKWCQIIFKDAPAGHNDEAIVTRGTASAKTPAYTDSKPSLVFSARSGMTEESVRGIANLAGCGQVPLKVVKTEVADNGQVEMHAELDNGIDPNSPAAIF
jgi:hypothetical protein